MEFNFENYKGKYVMHCKTEKEAEEFCKLMHDNKMYWASDSRYDKCNYYYLEGDTICYDFNKGNFGSENYYGKHNYIILEWEDFMDFKKDDLKAGYVVQFRNGDYQIVTDSIHGLLFLNMRSFIEVDQYKNELTFDGFNKEVDVIKVWGFAYDISQSLFIGTISRKLLWERKEPKELTMQEIADKFGVDVKDLKIKK